MYITVSARSLFYNSKLQLLYSVRSNMAKETLTILTYFKIRYGFILKYCFCHMYKEAPIENLSLELGLNVHSTRGRTADLMIVSQQDH